MYQVFDSELFGIAASPPLPPLPPLPPVDDDYALQRYRGPGDDIDSVLGFLGLGLPPHVHGGGGGGGQMDGTADDPGGGWGGCPGDGTAAAAAAGWRKAFGGQLMDSDDYDYVDYSCFSSGVTSPDLDSEFFARAITTTSSMGGSLAGASKLDVASSAAYHPWEFAPISSLSSSSSTGLLRSHSPHFHLETSSSPSDFPLPDRAFSIDRFEGGRGLREEFDSEAEARVREIARYLASFEVQSWPNNDRQMAAEGVSSAASDSGASLFSIATSMMGTNIDHVRSSVTTKSDLSSDGGRVFHPGYDDACCGLESTMVNPNEVFPDRVDRSDHQYASRPSHRPQAAAAAAAAASAAGERPSTDRHTQRTSNPSGEKTTKGGGAGGGGGGSGGGGVSVLEALLRSNEPIDPNKGSGAAVRLDSNPEQSSTGGLRCGVDHSAVHKTTSTASTSSPEGVLKKLLTARNKDGGGGDSAAAEGLRRSDVNGGGGGGSEEHGQSFVTRPPVVVGSAESGFVGRIH